MGKNKLKTALEAAYMQEMRSIPSDSQLEREYSFSAAFTARMEDIIKQVNRDYITVFGFAAPRTSVIMVFAALILLPVGWLYYIGFIDRSAARLFVAVAEFFLLAAFGTNMRKETRNFSRGYKTAFTDGDDEEGITQELEFFIPASPEGYTKTGEYRTTVSHMVEYKDILGRTINYNRIDIHHGVLTKIDSADSITTKLDIKGAEAVCFVKDGLTNLVWADKNYRYQLKGDCTAEMLKEMAESI